MSAVDWTAVVVGVISVMSAVAGGIRWMVKHYLAELKPNHGSSMNDRVTRIEAQIDRIYELLIGNK